MSSTRADSRCSCSTSKKLLADYPFDPAPLIDGAVHDGWAATRLQRFVVAWNTKNANRPASWEALGDPAGKGKIAIEPGDWDWYSRLWTYWVEERGVRRRRLTRGSS